MTWSYIPVAIILLLVGNTLGSAQQFVISTYAGGAPPPTPTPGVNASIGRPHGVAIDPAGNVYFSSDNCVFKLDQKGVLTRVAGNSRAGYSGDGGPATIAQLNGPDGVAVDRAGNLYIADDGNDRIRRVSPDGLITTIAGNGTSGYSGDGGLATSAQLSDPRDVAMDSAGNLYIADTANSRVREVSQAGIITTVAGNGTYGFSGDGGSTANAEFRQPAGIAVDSAGSLYVADSGNTRVRRISPTGIITTIAGNGIHGFSGDGGIATDAALGPPTGGIAVDSAGNVYIADTGNNRVRRVSPAGIIMTFAGGGYSGDGGPATSAQLTPSGVAVDNAGNPYIADYFNNSVRRVSPAGTITTIAGNGIYSYSGDGGPAINAQLSAPSGLAVDGAHDLYIADDNRIRRISPTGIITTIAGNGIHGYSGDGRPAARALLAEPVGVAVDSAGNVYIADSSNCRVRRVSPSGVITTVAGNGTFGYSGDGGPATNAQLSFIQSVTVNSNGNLYIADTANNRIRKVSPVGIITTVAGNGTEGYSGDGDLATSAQLNNPFGVTVDGRGNLYIADTQNIRVRTVSPAGIIMTVAGNGNNGNSGDGGPATGATVSFPFGVAVDTVGNLYIADGSGVRKVSAAGIITTIAGKGTRGYSGDGGTATATSAQLNGPQHVAVDSAGNLYIADSGNSAIRLLQPIASSITISSVASAATNLSGPISPGEIVVLFGSALGPAELDRFHVNSAGNIDIQLAGTSVSFNGTPAPIIYTSSTQVAAIVPYEASGTNAQVAVIYQGQTSPSFNVPVASSAPGLFTLDSTGQGQAAVVNQDGSINSPGHPAPIGSIVTLFATGEGQISPAGVDGKPAQEPLPQPLLPVTVTLGGQTVTPQYAGGAPGEVEGLMQINLQIPLNTPQGNAVPVMVSLGAFLVELALR